MMRGSGGAIPAGPIASLVLAAMVLSGCSRREAPDAAPSADLPIRIQILPDQAGPVTVSSRGNVRISTLPDLILRFEGSLPKAAAFAPEGEGFRLAGQYYPSPIRISPQAVETIAVRASGEIGTPGQAYRGTLDILNIGGRIRVINQVGLEQYLDGVVTMEMPATFSPEALQSQAIASRTYALYHMKLQGKRPLDKAFDGTASFQVYGGASGETEASRLAVRATRGQALTWRGKLFPAYFQSTCGGNTTNGALVFGGEDLPPLRGVPCDGCAASPWRKWTLRIPLRAAEPLLKAWAGEQRIAMGDLRSFQGLEPLPGGYLSFVRVVHAKGSFEMRADVFKRVLNRGGMDLKSTSFDVIPGPDGQSLELTGRGFGHGVGMCQYGANWMGRTAKAWQILAYYYPDSELKKEY